MSDSEFETLADSLLETLEEALGDHVDAELQGGILTIEGRMISEIALDRVLPETEALAA